MRLKFSELVTLLMAALLIPILLFVIVRQDETIKEQRTNIRHMYEHCPVDTR